jgi:hypothetical protein
MRKACKTATAIFFLWGRFLQVDFKKTKGMGENVTPLLHLSANQLGFRFHMRKAHKTVTAIFFLWSRYIQVDFKKAKGMGENLTPRIAFNPGWF